MNVPVLVQYMFDNGFRFSAGSQFGFLMSAKSNSNNAEFDRIDDYKGLELRTSFGMSGLATFDWTVN